MIEFMLAHPWMTFFVAIVCVWEAGVTVRSFAVYRQARLLEMSAASQFSDRSKS